MITFNSKKCHMKKMTSLLMGLVMLAATSFGQAKQETKKTEKSAATTTTTTTSPKLKKDGTVDKRFKENKTTTTTAAGPLKKDGTLDKRYKKNKG